MSHIANVLRKYLVMHALMLARFPPHGERNKIAGFLLAKH
jgi:hypothetical protein